MSWKVVYERGAIVVRITAQPVNAITGHHLWADRFDREMKDVFARQDEITKKIVQTLAG
ncbi:MAG: hypothetical protein ACE5JS_21265 [Nitrospinota bacterium]